MGTVWRTGDGVVAPGLSEAAIAASESSERISAVNNATVSAIRDIVASATREDIAAVATWLNAVLQGLSADERGAVVTERADQDRPVYGELPIDPDDEYTEFMCQVPEFERHLVRSSVHLVKFWFSVSRDEQQRRFVERRKHPLKQWKLSPVDPASLDKWDEYTEAKNAMFLHTDTPDAPWTVIKSDCKKRSRLNAIRFVLQTLPHTEKDSLRIGPLDPLLVGRPVSTTTS